MNCRLGNLAIADTALVAHGQGSLAMQVLTSFGASGGTLSVGCEGTLGTESVTQRSLILTRVATAAGVVST